MVRPRGRTTSRRDVGRYAGKGEGLPVELKVARAGRRVRDFQAQVSTFCLGGTVEDNRFLIGVAPVKRIRIAPDGRFYSISRPGRDTTVEVYGRLRRGRVRGTARLTIGICDGIADYSVKLRR